MKTLFNLVRRTKRPNKWPRINEARVAFAKELRRAAWSAAAIISGLGLFKATFLGVVFGAFVWTFIQLVAFVVLANTPEKKSTSSAPKRTGSANVRP
jgi:hypothetical protein